MKDLENKKYRNFYKCSECGKEWQDEWDSTCNDRCPDCDAEIEPYKSEDIDPVFNAEEVAQEALKALDESGHLHTSLLDDIVHNLASRHASSINNEGSESQVNYIIDQLGPEALKDIKQAIADED